SDSFPEPCRTVWPVSSCRPNGSERQLDSYPWPWEPPVQTSRRLRHISCRYTVGCPVRTSSSIRRTFELPWFALPASFDIRGLPVVPWPPPLSPWPYRSL